MKRTEPTSSCRCCGAPIPRRMLACKIHWYALPAPLRAAINATWRARNMRAYIDNVREADRVWMEQR